MPVQTPTELRTITTCRTWRPSSKAFKAIWPSLSRLRNPKQRLLIAANAAGPWRRRRIKCTHGTSNLLDLNQYEGYSLDLSYALWLRAYWEPAWQPDLFTLDTIKYHHIEFDAEYPIQRVIGLIGLIILLGCSWVKKFLQRSSILLVVFDFKYFCLPLKIWYLPYDTKLKTT